MLISTSTILQIAWRLIFLILSSETITTRNNYTGSLNDTGQLFPFVRRLPSELTKWRPLPQQLFPVFCITNVSHSARGFHYIPYTHPPWPLLFICFPTQKMPQEEFCTLAVSNFSPPRSFEAIPTRFSLSLQRLLLRTQMTTTLRVAVIRSWTFCCLTVSKTTVSIYFLHEIPAWIWDILLMFSHLPGHSASVFYDDFLDCPTSRHLLSKWSLPVFGH